MQTQGIAASSGPNIDASNNVFGVNMIESAFNHQPHIHHPDNVPNVFLSQIPESTLALDPSQSQFVNLSSNGALSNPAQQYQMPLSSSAESIHPSLSVMPHGASAENNDAQNTSSSRKPSTRKRKSQSSSSDATITIPVNINRPTGPTPGGTSPNSSSFILNNLPSDSKDDLTSSALIPLTSGMVQIGSKMFEESQLDSIDESTLTMDERKQLKKQRRLVKNREAAQLFRQRQKEYIVNLERRAAELTQANHEASARVELLASENKLMKEQLVYLRNFMKQAVSFSFPFDAAQQTPGLPNFMAQPGLMQTFGAPLTLNSIPVQQQSNPASSTNIHETIATHIDPNHNSIPLMKMSMDEGANFRGPMLNFSMSFGSGAMGSLAGLGLHATNQQGVAIDGANAAHLVSASPDLVKDQLSLYPD